MLSNQILEEVGLILKVERTPVVLKNKIAFFLIISSDIADVFISMLPSKLLHWEGFFMYFRNLWFFLVYPLPALSYSSIEQEKILLLDPSLASFVEARFSVLKLVDNLKFIIFCLCLLALIVYSFPWWSKLGEREALYKFQKKITILGVSKYKVLIIICPYYYWGKKGFYSNSDVIFGSNRITLFFIETGELKLITRVESLLHLVFN